MKAIVTGMNGTVAPALAAHLRAGGHEVVAWDRAAVATDDPDARRGFVEDVAPGGFFHVATGSPAWAEAVAGLCAARGVPFVFTSSASVFSDRARGPHGPDAAPDATDDYGRYKIECEQRVRAANPGAVIARLGWQLGPGAGANTMFEYFRQEEAREGRIRASTRWLPACSALEDTADALLRLMLEHPAGTYQLDGNPGLSMYDIARGLARRHELAWEVAPTEDRVFDNRMVDDRVRVGPITARL